MQRIGFMLASVALVALSGVGASPATASQPQVTHEVTHFEKSQHFDANPDCGAPVGVTEYGTGTEHLVVVEDGDTLHVTYGEQFRIVEVSDDPSISPVVRHGSDALSFQIVNGGAVEIFHESFHDQPTSWGNIGFTTTFVAVDGQVKVDHFFGRDLPDEGC